MKTLSPISPTREKVLALLDSDPTAMRVAIIGSGAASDDHKLVELTIHAGHVAAFIKDKDWLFCHLVKIYGFTAGWLMKLGVQHVQNAIDAERDRQDELFATGELLFNCASRVATPARKLRVLMEEIGEVAEALDHIETVETNNRSVRRLPAVKEQLRVELIQVAAVAVGWLESLE